MRGRFLPDSSSTRSPGVGLTQPVTATRKRSGEIAGRAPMRAPRALMTNRMPVGPPDSQRSYMRRGRKNGNWPNADGGPILPDPWFDERPRREPRRGQRSLASRVIGGPVPTASGLSGRPRPSAVELRSQGLTSTNCRRARPWPQGRSLPNGSTWAESLRDRFSTSLFPFESSAWRHSHGMRRYGSDPRNAPPALSSGTMLEVRNHRMTLIGFGAGELP